ncbi:MAG: ImmA/IrrE family metallo-endopeptidase [Romboutsia sp.]|uniref:ImmA/IrrE family metallo-endopeptidase n=1 Tax=Romboutsia sp. TaxID=1965302 RepID=UPI003F3820A1
MSKLEKLYKLAEEFKIIIHFFDLKHIEVLGLNVEKENMPHMIFLDHSIKKDNKLHLEILAHELGHYFTTVGDFISNTKTYRHRLEATKCENKADRWAYDYLLPEQELIIAIKKNINTIDDLSSHFEVRTEFFIKRFEYLALRKQMLHLDKNKYLILTNLPNIYIYEDIGGHYEY